MRLTALRHRRVGVWQKLSARVFSHFLYDTPWYLVIGAPGTGKTEMLRNANLQLPQVEYGIEEIRGVGGTRSFDWWFAERAVILDTSGRFTTQDSDPAHDRVSWARLLNLLKKSRPRQPLNGVLVTVSVLDLLSKVSAGRAGPAHDLRARLLEIHEHLGPRIPVYVLITKCDLMSGFEETFAQVDEVVRVSPWGFVFPIEPDLFLKALPREFDLLVRRLNDGLIGRLQAERDPERLARIYGFILEFASLRPRLDDFLLRTFSSLPLGQAPNLRGVHFVSASQWGMPIDRVFGSIARRYRIERVMQPTSHNRERSYFLERFFSEVVLADRV